MVGRPLRVLNVEDSEDDAMLLFRHLRRAGYDVVFERVDTLEAMRAALDHRTWDIVIADFVLPSFSAPAALALLRERTPHLPCIFVSGVVGEDEVSVAANREGVQDYLLKSQMAQLIPAIGLAAGVVPEEERPAAHLSLCKAYLDLAGNLTKAVVHGEQALQLAEARGLTALPVLEQAARYLAVAHSRLGQYAEAAAALRRVRPVQDRLDLAARAEIHLQLGLVLETLGEMADAARELQQAALDYQALGLPARAQACRLHLSRIRPDPNGGSQAVPCGWAELIEAAETHLMVGDPVQAVRVALEALHEAGENSERCFRCYMLLKRCAREQGHLREAMNFAISARLMALDARRHDLALEAARAMGTLVARAGKEAEGYLRELDQEYQRWGVDLYSFLPRAMDDTWE